MSKYIFFSIIIGIVLQACKTSLSDIPNSEISSQNKVEPIENSIIVYGDTRDATTVHEEIVKLILKNKPIAVFHTGDLVNNGMVQKQWDIFTEIIKPLRETVPFYPVLGNHERDF